MDADPRLELIYRESVRALDSQSSSVIDVRSRGFSLMGTVAGVSGLVGAISPGNGFDRWAGLAVGAFLLSFAFAVASTWPRRFRFEHNAVEMLHEYVDGEHVRSIDDMHRWLATYNQGHYEANHAILECGLRGCWRRIPGTTSRRGVGPLFCLRLSAGGLAIEILAWLIHLRR